MRIGLVLLVERVYPFKANNFEVDFKYGCFFCFS